MIYKPFFWRGPKKMSPQHWPGPHTHTIFLTLKVIESEMQHSQQLEGDQAIKQSLWDLCDFISIQDPEDKHRYNANRKQWINPQCLNMCHPCATHQAWTCLSGTFMFKKRGKIIKKNHQMWFIKLNPRLQIQYSCMSQSQFYW